MTLVTGFSPQESGSAALELAAVVARSTGQDLVVAVVVARPHLTLVTDLPDEYVQVLTGWAESALDQARAALPADVTARFEVRTARSIPAGLEELVAETGATVLVLGSSTKGHQGRISLGSITDRVTHGAEATVVLAPHGYRAGPSSRVERVTVAYDGSATGLHLLEAGLRWARDTGAPLRVATFAVRPQPVVVLATGLTGPEDLVIRQWVRRCREALAEHLEKLRGRDETAALGDLTPESLEVGTGTSWRGAVEDLSWSPDELLLLGSSSSASPARVFLGSRASKILRHAPVPVMLVPGD
jgi:nucleotide-binding universal stress UspA family protein